MDLLEFRNVGKAYGSGDYVAIIGETGSGKSTLLNMIGAFIGFIIQAFNLSDRGLTDLGRCSE